MLEPDIEAVDPEKIRAIQLKRLRRTLNVARRSELYRGKFRGMSRKPIKSLEDLSGLKMTTKEDLRASYPFGAVAVNIDHLLLFVHSSGTTGKVIGIYHTEADLEAISSHQARCYYGTGIRNGDKVQLMISPVAGHGFTRSLHRIGALTIFTGPGNPVGQLAFMRDLGVTTVFGLPSFLMHLAGRDPGLADIPVHRLIAMGEPLTNANRRRLENSWGAEVYSLYGSTELGGGFSECKEHDGHHVHWDSFLLEVIDPDTGEATDGVGELVFTTLKREGTPLIRYRTGDLVRMERDPCSCGRRTPRIFPMGRADEMMKIKGTAVYPSVLREELTAVEEISSFQIVVEREKYLDRLELRAEAREPGPELKARLVELIKGTTGVTPIIKFESLGSLAKGTGKVKQFIDKRKI